MKEFELLNGNMVPALAYGTWLIKNENAANCVKMALEAGYRHIDTAQAYGNEEGVGIGMKESGLKREEIYLTTKVMAELKTYKKAKKSIDDSLKRLGVDYIDLILIHCPQPWVLFRGKRRFFKENIEVWKAFIDLKKQGKVRSIGVSNFRVNNLENIINATNVVPSVNQIRFFIGNTQEEVVKYCQEKNILIEAYSPLSTGEILNSKELDEISNKYNKSKAQICIRYCIERNTLPLPKSVHEERIIQNADIDFEIDKKDMEYLNSLTLGTRKPLRS